MNERRRNRDLQDYTDRFGRTSEPRLSRRDEQRLTDEARAREQTAARELAEQLAAEQAERDAELARATLHALRAVEHVRELLRDDRREIAKDIDHHARRLRAKLEALRLQL